MASTKTDTTEQADETVVAVKEFTHSIAGTPERGFYRAGRHWPREGVEVNRSEFTDEQWAALEAEPRVTITEL